MCEALADAALAVPSPYNLRTVLCNALKPM